MRMKMTRISTIHESGSSGRLLRVCAISGACLHFAVGILRADDKWPTTTETLPPASQIIEEYIEATGGKAARKKLHNRVMTGTLVILQKKKNRTTSGPYTTYASVPNRNYRLWEPTGLGEFDWGTDGKVAWEITPTKGPRILEGEEKAATIRSSTFHFELEWPRLYKKMVCKGIKKVEEQKFYAVVMTPHVGKPETLYFDSETKLLLTRETTVVSPSGKSLVAVAYGDYKKVDGVLLPHTFAQRSVSSDMIYSFEKVEHNVDIPESRFELPDVIKVSLERRKKENPKAEPSAPADERP